MRELRGVQHAARSLESGLGGGPAADLRAAPFCQSGTQTGPAAADCRRLRGLAGALRLEMTRIDIEFVFAGFDIVWPDVRRRNEVKQQSHRPFAGSALLIAMPFGC